MNVTDKLYDKLIHTVVVFVLTMIIRSADGQTLISFAVDDHLPACGSTQYDPRRYFCCSEKLFQRWNNDSCCGITPYNSTDQMCCDGRLSSRRNTHSCCSAKPYNTCHKLCCGGNSYDVRHYMCCDGVARLRGNGFKCCGGQTYRKLDQLCCGGKPHSKLRYVCSHGRAVRKEEKDHTHACGKTKTYNFERHLCCKDHQLVAGRSKYDECCGVSTYNTRTHQCCGERIYLRSVNDSCCNSEDLFLPYDSQEHICCNGQLAKRTFGAQGCCGTQAYDTKNICCNNTVLPRKSSTVGCCTKDAISNVFDKGESICCDGKLYSKNQYTACCIGTQTSDITPYHESKEICCNGQVYPKSSFNRCCYNPLGYVVPYNSSHHFCCDGYLHHGTSTTHMCCHGKAVLKPEPNAASPQYDCCGTYIYDTITQLCCNGKIYDKNGYDACCFSTDQPYHTSVSSCCCDKIYDKERFDGCCAGRGYNTKTHTCCWPIVHKKRKGHRCCNGAASLFHVTSQRCCSGSVVTGRVCSANVRPVNHLPYGSKKRRLPGVSLDIY